MTSVAAAQSCPGKAEGDGGELSDSNCDSNETGKCSRRKTQSPFLASSLANVGFTRFCGVQLSFCFVVWLSFLAGLPDLVINQKIWFNHSGDKQVLAQPCADLGEELLSSI